MFDKDIRIPDATRPGTVLESRESVESKEAVQEERYKALEEEIKEEMAKLPAE